MLAIARYRCRVMLAMALSSLAGDGAALSCSRPLGPTPSQAHLALSSRATDMRGPPGWLAPLFSPHKRCPAVTRLCPSHVMLLDSPLVYKKLPSAPLAISPSLHEFTPPDRIHPILHLPLVPFALPCHWCPSSLTKFLLSYHRCFPSLVGTLLQP
jgi:hypothetical protein